MLHRLLALCVCLFAASPAQDTFAQGAETGTRTITPIRGNLFQARDGDQVTVFLVTPAGIILADPLNTDAARWLKTELAARFPEQPIRYVLYTGHRFDRARGASVLTDTAEIVAHERFQSERRRASASLPSAWAVFDRNGNARLERSEATAIGADAAERDHNQDGEVTPEEIWGDVASPELTYRGMRRLELGGQRVTLVHPGDGLGADATVLLFENERFVFAPDVHPREAPSSFNNGSPSDFVEAIRQIERLGFESLLSDRGESFGVADLGLLREYVEAMAKGVTARFRAGDSVEQIQASLDLSRFSQLGNLPAVQGRNIADTYRRLNLLTVSVSGAAELASVERGTPRCAANAIATIQLACEGIGGRAWGGGAGAAFSVGRYGGAVEFARAGRLTGQSQTLGTLAVSHEFRERVMSFLFRYDARPGERLGLVLTAGRSRISGTGRTSGTASQYYSGYFLNYDTTRTASANTFGADISTLVKGVRVAVPVRVMREPEQLFYDVGGSGAYGEHDQRGSKWNLRLGIGVTIPVARTVLQ